MYTYEACGYQMSPTGDSGCLSYSLGFNYSARVLFYVGKLNVLDYFVAATSCFIIVRDKNKQKLVLNSKQLSIQEIPHLRIRFRFRKYDGFEVNWFPF